MTEDDWLGRVSIDFTFPPDVEDARSRMRAFVDEDVRPTEERRADGRGRGDWRASLDRLRASARELGLWNPHMPEEWGGPGFGPDCPGRRVGRGGARRRFGSYVVNCYAPDEGNMHTLMHWGTDEQKEKYLRPDVRGQAAVVLRHDRAGGGGLGPHPHADAGRAPTATSG